MIDKKMYALHYNSKVQVIAGSIWVFLDALVSSLSINVLIHFIGPTPDAGLYIHRRVYISILESSNMSVIAP